MISSKMIKTIFHTIFISIFFVACTTLPQVNQKQVVKNKINKNFVKGELLVGIGLKENYKDTISSLTSDENISLIRILSIGKTTIVHFKVPKNKEFEYINKLEKNKNVLFAETNNILSIDKRD